VWAARKRLGKEERPILLEAGSTGLEALLEPDLPEEAYHKLLELDVRAGQVGLLRYDRLSRAWK
jgi:hypothetical protein